MNSSMYTYIYIYVCVFVQTFGNGFLGGLVRRSDPYECMGNMVVYGIYHRCHQTWRENPRTEWRLISLGTSSQKFCRRKKRKSDSSPTCAERGLVGQFGNHSNLQCGDPKGWVRNHTKYKKITISPRKIVI